MPELRTDWLTGRSVLVAENRANRPNDFERADIDPGPVVKDSSRDKTIASCPFCKGNESRTPEATYESLDDQGNWQVRIVPNVFPAVEGGASPVAAALAPSPADPRQTSSAAGVHEVIIECPSHIDRLSELSADELHHVVQSYAARLSHWRESGRYNYGLVFKNQGHRAGASIAHLHSQLVALPFVPAAVEAERRRAAESYSLEACCPYCQIINKEQAAEERIVLARDGFIAFCPFASWQPCEVWLMPTDHQPSFESASPEELERLTRVLHPLISRLEATIPGASYNLLLRTAPWTGEGAAWSHWRIELLPRVNAFAGLEIATGIHINPVAPERAARHLRQA